MSHLRLDDLREKLLRAGIAPRHVRRYLGELRQHFDDLSCAEFHNGLSGEAAFQAVRARLGDDDSLAAAMLVQPELRSLTSRLPWLVFGIAPIFMPFAMFTVIALLMVFSGWLGGAMFIHHETVAPAWFRLLCQMGAQAATFLVPLMAASTMVSLAIRQRMPFPWPLLGIAVIVIFGMHMNATFPGPNTRGGSIGVGTTLLPMPHLPANHASRVQWVILFVQLGLSLLPVLWLLIWSRRARASNA